MAVDRSAMEGPDELNSTDRDILNLLSEGRETTGSLSDATNKSSNYIRNRIRLLRLNGWVRYYHEPTALHELIEDPRE